MATARRLRPVHSGIEQSPGHGFRRRLIINTLATGAGNGWAMVVSVVSVPVVLHGIGPEAFGLWIILQTFSAVTGWFSLADLGVGTAAVRSIAGAASLGDENGIHKSIGTTLVIFGTMGVASSVLLGAFGPLVLPRLFHSPHRLDASLRIATVLAAAQIAADLLTEGAESCMEGLQRVDLSRFVDAYRRTAVAIGISIAALLTGGLVWVAVVSTACAFSGAGVALAIVWRLGGHRPPAFDRDEARLLFRYGRTIAVLRPLGVVQRTMDRVVVGVILGPMSVTLVELATQVVNGADAVLSGSSYAVIPGSSWLRARGDSPQLRELLLRGTKYSLLATWLVCAAAAGLAGPFVHVWVGTRYLAAAPLVGVALAGEAIAAPCQIGSSLLLGTGRANDILRAALLALAVNLVASVVLVHAIGIMGAFVGTLIANVVLVPPLLSAAFDEVGTTPGAFIRQAMTPAIVPALAVLAASWGTSQLPLGTIDRLGIGIAACAAITTMAVVATRSLREEFVEMAASLRRRSA